MAKSLERSEWVEKTIGRKIGDDGERSVKGYPGFWLRQAAGWMGLLPKLEEMGGRII